MLEKNRTQLPNTVEFILGKFMWIWSIQNREIHSCISEHGKIYSTLYHTFIKLNPYLTLNPISTVYLICGISWNWIFSSSVFAKDRLFRIIALLSQNTRISSIFWHLQRRIFQHPRLFVILNILQICEYAIGLINADIKRLKNHISIDIKRNVRILRSK